MEDNKFVPMNDDAIKTVSGGADAGSIPFKFKSRDWVSFTLSDNDGYFLRGEVGGGCLKEYNGVLEPHYTIAVDGPVGPRPYRDVPEHRIRK